MTIYSAAILLFLVMDPLGNIPVFMSVLKDVEEKRRKWIILREAVIAFGVLCLFLVFGRPILNLLQISEPSLGIAGGVILFIISIKMIFPPQEGVFGASADREPLIVPLAIPLIAGPSAIATVMLFASRDPGRMFDWFLALFSAWVISTIILFSSGVLRHIFRRRGLAAIERLMGMILTAISIQMLLNGIEQFLAR
ncbi:MAG: NAAT family transporter [Candidatus Marinimicrobia bacterium]|nr:NAAT family transporter [Candidatus Neomarinimicrobiota bacterium]MCF7829185.1 NAAT family transporter [Candidatus Neomarinimicrobiota bacterium]MCF7881162.1 NAAT family transporter [Candidatus Neomarinimicrobiota bacterium]